MNRYGMNLFANFKLYEGERPDMFASTIKKQFKVPKSLWFGMPILISNAKLGKYKIRQPKMFYVTDYDRNTVTLKPMPDYPGIDNDDDVIDDEIDKDRKDNDAGEVIIAKKEFYKLLEPEGMQPGGDPMAGGAPGGAGGI